MKWMKHMTGTSRDEKIARLVRDGSMERHALYGLYWRVNEIIGEQMEGASPSCSVSYPVSVWARMLPLRGSLVGPTLAKLAEQGTELLTVERTGDDIRVTNLNILKYRDEYSKKSGHAPEKIQPAPEAPAEPQPDAPKPEKGEQQERERQELLIYDEYPRKVGKPAAIRAIRSAVKRLGKGSDKLAPMDGTAARRYLFKQARDYAASPAGQKPPPGGEDFRPHPATWFNQERYLDTAEWQKPNGARRGTRAPASADATVDNVRQLLRPHARAGADHHGPRSDGDLQGDGSRAGLSAFDGGKVIEGRFAHSPAGD